MARYIDADALGIGKAKREVFNDPAYADGWNSAIEIIENAPTIEARPVVRGEWIEKQEPIPWADDDVDVFWECSVCECRNYGPTPFCPNCGADMRPKEESEDAGN